MAYIRLDFLSESLRKITTLSIVIPNDVPEEEKEDNIHYKRNMKTLYLLHGFTGNHTDWICGTNIHTLCKKYNFAVVCPSGDNSFYVDREMTGCKYGTFVGKEVVEYTRKMLNLSGKREDTYIGGYSMGGYGAILNGMKYHQTFSKIIAFSSGLFIDELLEAGDAYEDGLTNPAYRLEVFGDLKTLENSEKNPKFVIEQIKKKKGIIPELYLACGTEDFLIGNNRRFVEHLNKNQIPVIYKEESGKHDWDYWNKALEPAIGWLMQ